MSLADELLADLEDMDRGQTASVDTTNTDQNMDTDTFAVPHVPSLNNNNSVHSVAKLNGFTIIDRDDEKNRFLYETSTKIYS